MENEDCRTHQERCTICLLERYQNLDGARHCEIISNYSPSNSNCEC